MRAEWLGGPRDGEKIELPEGTDHILRPIERPLSALPDTLYPEAELDFDVERIPLRKYRSAAGPIKTMIDYHDLATKLYGRDE